jgi:hypothetical protein
MQGWIESFAQLLYSSCRRRPESRKLLKRLDSRQKLVPEVFCRGIAGMTGVVLDSRLREEETEVEAGMTKLLGLCGCANVSRRFGAKDIMAFLH